MEINDLICLNVKIEHWVKALASQVEEGLYVLCKKRMEEQGGKKTNRTVSLVQILDSGISSVRQN